MPGFLYHVNASTLCPHGGQGTTSPGTPRVTVGGQPVATSADTTMVAACPFVNPGGVAQPCVEVQWLTPATRVFAGGQPVLLQNSPALCLAAGKIPQGAPIVNGQVRVRGT